MHLTKLSIIGAIALCLNLFGTQSAQAEEKILSIGLVGDSTVAKSYGWGPAFTEQLQAKVKVLNYARNGATLESLSKKLDELIEKKPDYIIIQFGHNDMKRFTPDAYGKNLKDYVERVQCGGIQPIIFSSVTRRSFGDDGKVEPWVFNGRTLAAYSQEAGRVARAMSVPFVDLNAVSLAHHNLIGPEESATYNFKPDDYAHFSKKGAQGIAALVIKELRAAIPSMAHLGR